MGIVATAAIHSRCCQAQVLGAEIGILAVMTGEAGLRDRLKEQ